MRGKSQENSRVNTVYLNEKAVWDDYKQEQIKLENFNRLASGFKEQFKPPKLEQRKDTMTSKLSHTSPGPNQDRSALGPSQESLSASIVENNPSLSTESEEVIEFRKEPVKKRPT